MPKRWWNRRATSLPELLLQTAFVAGALLLLGLVLTESARDAWVYTGILTATWLGVGVLELLWSKRRA